MDCWKFLGTSRIAENTVGEPLYFYLQKLMNSMTFVTLVPPRLSDYLVIRLSLSWENQAGDRQVMFRKSEKVWRMNGTQDSKIEGPKWSATIKIL